MKNNIEILDIVTVLQDIPVEKLNKGNIGTVVEILDEEMFLVEFCDKNGKTLKMLELSNNQIMKINFELEPEFA
jgi:hypothetical protein